MNSNNIFRLIAISYFSFIFSLSLIGQEIDALQVFSTNISGPSSLSDLILDEEGYIYNVIQFHTYYDTLYFEGQAVTHYPNELDNDTNLFSSFIVKMDENLRIVDTIRFRSPITNVYVENLKYIEGKFYFLLSYDDDDYKNSFYIGDQYIEINEQYQKHPHILVETDKNFQFISYNIIGNPFYSDPIDFTVVEDIVYLGGDLGLKDEKNYYINGDTIAHWEMECDETLGSERPLFIAAFDLRSKELLWSEVIGNCLTLCEFDKIERDNHGNIYFSIQISGPVDFKGITYSGTGTGPILLFNGRTPILFCLSPEGELIFAKNMEQESGQAHLVDFIITENNDILCLVDYYWDKFALDDFEVLMPNNSGFTSIRLKLDSSGSVKWIKTIQSVSNSDYSFSFFKPKKDKFYWFSLNVDAQKITLGNEVIIFEKPENYIFVKMDAEGNILGYLFPNRLNELSIISLRRRNIMYNDSTLVVVCTNTKEEGYFFDQYIDPPGNRSHFLILAKIKDNLRDVSTSNFTEPGLTTNINIYPNPVVDGRISISGLTESTTPIQSISIHDVMGIKRWSIDHPDMNIDPLSFYVPHLSTGVYNVNIKYRDGRVHTKQIFYTL